MIMLFMFLHSLPLQLISKLVCVESGAGILLWIPPDACYSAKYKYWLLHPVELYSRGMWDLCAGEMMVGAHVYLALLYAPGSPALS